MDVLFNTEVLGLFVAFVAFCLVLYMYSKWKLGLWYRLGVPGPPPTVFLGSIPLYKKLGVFKADQEMVKKYGNIFGMYFGHIPGIVIADPDLVRKFMVQDFALNPNRPNPLLIDNEMKNHLTNLTDEQWRLMRNTFNTLMFSAGKIRKMEPIINKRCDTLMEILHQKVCTQETIDFKEVFWKFAFDAIFGIVLGMDIPAQTEHDNEFVENTLKLIESIKSPLTLSIAIFPLSKYILNAFGCLPYNNRRQVDFFKSVILKEISNQECTEKKDDLLHTMMNMHSIHYSPGDNEKWKKIGMTTNEIVANIIFFLIAGQDTTSTAMTFTVYCLATNPECQEKVCQEIDSVLGKDYPTYDSIQQLTYLDCFFKETLRLYSPATRTSREASQDFELGGFHIPKGTDVAVSIYSLHYNPLYWPNPNEFNPDRFKEENETKRNQYAFLPFGLGPRNCVAMRLAQTEIKTVIIRILQRYTLEVCEETEIPIPIGKGPVMTPENSVYLKLKPRYS